MREAHPVAAVRLAHHLHLLQDALGLLSFSATCVETRRNFGVKLFYHSIEGECVEEEEEEESERVGYRLTRTHAPGITSGIALRFSLSRRAEPPAAPLAVASPSLLGTFAGGDSAVRSTTELMPTNASGVWNVSTWRGERRGGLRHRDETRACAQRGSAVRRL